MGLNFQGEFECMISFESQFMEIAAAMPSQHSELHVQP